MSEEPAHLRLQRITRGVLQDRLVTLEDAEFLVQRLANAEQMLRAQQDAVSDASRRWREIGYQEGWEQGYNEGYEWANRSPVEET